MSRGLATDGISTMTVYFHLGHQGSTAGKQLNFQTASVLPKAINMPLEANLIPHRSPWKVYSQVGVL